MQCRILQRRGGSTRLYVGWLENWGECDECGGGKRRYRLITAMPKNGRKPCERHLPMEQVTNCTRACHERKYCVWGDWSDYGDCSAACGADYKQRTRSLTVKSGDAPDTSTLCHSLILEKEQTKNEKVQAMVWIVWPASVLKIVVSLRKWNNRRASTLK